MTYKASAVPSPIATTQNDRNSLKKKEKQLELRIFRALQRTVIVWYEATARARSVSPLITHPGAQSGALGRESIDVDNSEDGRNTKVNVDGLFHIARRMTDFPRWHRPTAGVASRRLFEI
jgi:hypothetical protein